MPLSFVFVTISFSHLFPPFFSSNLLLLLLLIPLHLAFSWKVISYSTQNRAANYDLVQHSLGSVHKTGLLSRHRFAVWLKRVHKEDRTTLRSSMPSNGQSKTAAQLASSSKSRMRTRRAAVRPRQQLGIAASRQASKLQWTRPHSSAVIFTNSFLRQRMHFQHSRARTVA